LDCPSFRKGVYDRKNPEMIGNPRHRPDLFIPKTHRVLKVFFGTRPNAMVKPNTNAKTLKTDGLILIATADA
jgi:hypothetical protein